MIDKVHVEVGQGECSVNGAPVTMEEALSAVSEMSKITEVKVDLSDLKGDFSKEDEDEPSEFEKSLTEEERTSPLVSWKDERLGQAVKELAITLSDRNGMQALAMKTSALMIANYMNRSNAQTSVINCEGVTIGEEIIGDYTVFGVRTDNLTTGEKIKLKVARILLSV